MSTATTLRDPQTGKPPGHDPYDGPGRFDLEIRPWMGATIRQAAEDAIEVCRKHGRTAWLVFDGFRVLVRPGEGAGRVRARYEAALRRARALEREVRAAEAVARTTGGRS